MAREIIYGIFAEDKAHKIFMENTIPQLVAHFGKSNVMKFIHSNMFTKHIIARNKQDVRTEFVEKIQYGQEFHKLDFCLVGLDADDDNHTMLFEEMNRKLKIANLSKVAIIYIPVQAIEYWLWHIKQQKEELAEIKDLETAYSRRQLKRMVYNRKRPTNAKSNPIVAKLTANYNINHLKNAAPSFAHFYYQFEAYLQSL